MNTTVTLGRRLARRGVVTLAVLAATAAGLSACSKGDNTNPDNASPAPVVILSGVSIVAPNHTVAVRDLQVIDPGSAGYKAGTAAPLAMQLWNNTDKPISLVDVTVASGGVVTLMSGKGADASPAGTKLSIVIPPGKSLDLNPNAGGFLQIRCLPSDVTQGMALSMTLTFDNGTKIVANTPVGLLSPGATPIIPSAAGNAAATCQ